MTTSSPSTSTSTNAASTTVLPGLFSVQKLDWPDGRGDVFLTYNSDHIRSTSRVLVAAFQVYQGKPHTQAGADFIVAQVAPFDGGVRIKVKVDYPNPLPIGTSILVLN
ncbi:hypothetical protein [Streptomyces luteocolor]|uniref:hypothetical protein n=1 Tax=Streptomyces luteocolor TaxID=285500 RepID=UPI000853093F|nr:hypothetical protein [Streptomyces luteocolor]